MLQTRLQPVLLLINHLTNGLFLYAAPTDGSVMHENPWVDILESPSSPLQQVSLWQHSLSCFYESRPHYSPPSVCLCLHWPVLTEIDMISIVDHMAALQRMAGESSWKCRDQCHYSVIIHSSSVYIRLINVTPLQKGVWSSVITTSLHGYHHHQIIHQSLLAIYLIFKHFLNYQSS